MVLSLTAKGSYRDPVSRGCWEPCSSCFRCDKRGSSACPLPNGCSGRPDKEGMRIPHPDDLCQCKQGVLRWVTKEGRVIIRRFESSPFKGSVKTDAQTEDERDWNAFISEKREQLNDPTWDPVQFSDGTSITDWTNNAFNK